MSYYRYRSYSPYWAKIHSYLCRCECCGGTTSKKFARANHGFCKKCASGTKPMSPAEFVAATTPATV